MRYGVGMGRDGFGWTGTADIRRKAQWPTWTPPSATVARQPELKQYRQGRAAGIANPLGARALYLYQDGKDTLYRIHGTLVYSLRAISGLLSRYSRLAAFGSRKPPTGGAATLMGIRREISAIRQTNPSVQLITSDSASAYFTEDALATWRL